MVEEAMKELEVGYPRGPLLQGHDDVLNPVGSVYGGRKQYS